MPQPITPGDKLLWCCRGLDEWAPTEIEIKKVGRKWAEFFPHSCWLRPVRFNIKTMHVEGFYGAMYRSEEDWQHQRAERDATRAADDAWWELRRGISVAWHRPPHLAADAILRLMAEMFPPASNG